MKKTALFILFACVLVAGQQVAPAAAPQAASAPARPANAPSDSDLYCAGFISTQAPSAGTKVLAGWDWPDQTRFSDREIIYLDSAGLQEGQRLAVLRRAKDPNPRELFRGQRGLLRPLGQLYMEMGRVKVTHLRGNIAIATVDFACDAIVPGDFVVPWEERARPTFRRPVAFDRFAPVNGRTTGRIVGSRDFDILVGTNKKVYLNVGADQGVKVGDYFRAVRTYEDIRRDELDSISLRAESLEDTQKDTQRVLPVARVKDLPRKSLGEMIVLNVTPRSSTAMVTFALETIQVGDGVEMMEEPPPVAEAPVVAPIPPTITCAADRTSLRAGESARITCEGASQDNRALAYSFASSRGRLTQRDNAATLDTTNMGPGSISVRAVVTDDRNLSAEYVTLVNVEEPPPAPAARKLNEIAFKPNSAYVDNAAKAILDDVALAAQRDPASAIQINAFTVERESARIGELRAQNAARYLTREKGIDAARVTTTGTSKGGRKADVWLVPAGASVPQ